MKFYIAKLSNIFFIKQEKKFFLTHTYFCKSINYKSFFKNNTLEFLYIFRQYYTNHFFKHKKNRHLKKYRFLYIYIFNIRKKHRQLILLKKMFFKVKKK